MGVLSVGSVILFEEASIAGMVYSNWSALAFGTIIFITLGIIIQALFVAIGKWLVIVSDWYPKWYYFPRIEADAKLTSENDVELTFTNPKKKQKMSFEAVYALIKSDARPLPSIADGVAPYRKRILFPPSEMKGNCSRRRVIGKVENGKVTLLMGKNNEHDMQLTAPGFYYYSNFFGVFRNRAYSGGGNFTIVIKENKEVKIQR